MRRILVLVFLLGIFVSFDCNAQKKVFEKKVDDELFNSEKGPNKKSFKHFYIQYSLFPVDYDGAKINSLKSNSYGFGYRYKYKVSSFYSFGFDANYLMNNFNLTQKDKKRLPNPIQHKNEVLRTNNLSLEFYQRINIGKSGNMLGLYFDFGGYAGVVFAPKHIYKDKDSDDDYNSKTTITKHKGLNYFEPFSYGLRSRFGYNKLSITAEHRLTRLVKNKFEYPKLPDWSIGIQLSLF
jgi:hypothetical protein